MFLKAAIVCFGYFAVVWAETPTCSVDGQIIPKKDCTGFYMCSNGQPIKMPDCPPGTVFSGTVNTCVHQGSYFDDCIPEIGRQLFSYLIVHAES